MNHPQQKIHIKLSSEEIERLVNGKPLGWFEEGTTDDGRRVDIEIRIEREYEPTN